MNRPCDFASTRVGAAFGAAAASLVLAGLALGTTGCQPGEGVHRPIEAGGSTAAQASGERGVGYDDVRPIFAQRCAECHPSKSEPNWLDFARASQYAKSGRLYARVVSTKTMPPAGSPQSAQITEEERKTIGRWAQEGGPLQPPVSAPATAAGGVGSASADGRASGPEQSCLGCHGQQRPDSETRPTIPRIAGQNKEYIVAQLRAFGWWHRADPGSAEMNNIASRMSEENVERTAAYFSSAEAGLAPQDSPTLDAAAVVRYRQGERLAQRACNSCHYNPGDVTSWPDVPRLAGQSELYLRNQLIYFRDGQRRHATMNRYVRDYSDQDIEALAIYYAALRPRPGAQIATRR